MTTPPLLEKYGGFKILKVLFWIAVNLFSALFIIFLYLIKPLKFLKWILLIDDKMGHLAATTDIFLRRIQDGTIKIEKNAFYIALASKNQPNLQLFKMVKRALAEKFKDRFEIIKISEPDYVQSFLRAVFSSKSLFGKSIFYQPIFVESYYGYKFSVAKPTLSFTKEEEAKGKKLLQKMGIPKNAWFVCFHNRDSSFLKKTSNLEEWKYYDYRDCDVKNYLKAAKYIASKGGFAIRMGSIVEKPLPKLKNPKIIDYATKYRTDFGDVYLPLKCKFFLGSTSGLSFIPAISNHPIANANVIPITHPPIGKGSMFIPKKIWSKKEKRFLTFREMIDFQGDEYAYTKDFKKAGLVPVENTAKEIFDLAKEMNERIDGKFKCTKQDEKLHNKFQAIFKSSATPYRYRVLIGTKFLRENKDLLK